MSKWLESSLQVYNGFGGFYLFICIVENIRKGVRVMCNLSQGIKEDGIAIGEARKEEKIILNMHNNGFTVEQIAMATDKNVEEVKAIIAGKEPALA